MFIYQSILTVLLLLLVVNTLNNLRLLHRPASLAPAGETPAPQAGPLVSVLVPARNEARNIARCVESLARQEYPQLEILVLDDQSEDDTAAIVQRLAQRYSTVRLLHGRPLPVGWHGKAFACHQLAQVARGEWLLFVDADTTFAPQCISAALAIAVNRQADLLTMLPRILVGGPGEALLLSIVPLTFGAWLPLGLVTSRRFPLLAGALGPFLLFRRACYERFGGHEAVRADIVEDMKLSRLVKQHGGQIAWIDGTPLMQIRFYHSFGEAWRGITKSTFATLNYSLLALLIGIPCGIALFLAPYAFLADGLLTRQMSLTLIWLPLAQIALAWLSRLLLAQRFHMSRSLALLHALTMLAIITMTLQSVYHSLFGSGITWKGRVYQFHTARRARQHGSLLAEALLVARLALAAGVALLGWQWGDHALGMAATLSLLGLSCSMLENVRAGQPDAHPLNERAAFTADLAAALANAAYLLLSGLLSLWLALLSLLAALVSARAFRWRGVAGASAAGLSGGLLLTAGARLPLLRTILIGWVLSVAFLARRSIAETVSAWFARLRPPM
jgi:chlorobactene glucosyltransferase